MVWGGLGWSSEVKCGLVCSEAIWVWGCLGWSLVVKCGLGWGSVFLCDLGWSWGGFRWPQCGLVGKLTNSEQTNVQGHDTVHTTLCRTQQRENPVSYPFSLSFNGLNKT